MYTNQCYNINKYLNFFIIIYIYLYFVLIFSLSLYPKQNTKTMQTLSNIIQIFGATLFVAFTYNVVLLIINQLKTK